MRETLIPDNETTLIAAKISGLRDFFGSPSLNFAVRVENRANKSDQARVERTESSVTYYVPSAFLKLPERKLHSVLYSMYRQELERVGQYHPTSRSDLNSYLVREGLWGPYQMPRLLKNLRRYFQK